jgi:fucose permease
VLVLFSREPTLATDDPQRGFTRSRAAVSAAFAAHAFASGTLGPWIPRLKEAAGLDASGLGVALTGFAAGLVLGTRAAGPAMRRAGGRRVVRAGVPALAAALALLPLARGLVSLVALFALLGLAGGLLDVAMNAEAVAVERRSSRRIMSAMHGVWSVSMLAGAAIASGGLAAGVPLALHLPGVAALTAAAALPFLAGLPAPPPAEDSPGGPAARWPIGRVLLVCLIAACSFLGEGVAAEWSAVYLRESVGAGAGAAGLGVVAFSAGMTASRFAGDRLVGRLGSRRLARAGASCAAIALAGALAAGGAAPAVAAFAVVGVGLGPIVPIAFRAAGAARLGRAGGEEPSALGLAVTSGYLGSILGPLLVGFLADQVGLGAALAVPAAACAVAAAAAGALPRPATPPTGAETRR